MKIFIFPQSCDNFHVIIFFITAFLSQACDNFYVIIYFITTFLSRVCANLFEKK